MRPIALLLAAGCVPTLPVEPDASWIKDLQVIGIEVDPPSIGAGGISSVEVTAADPRGRGADVLVWSCTDLGIGCFEQLLPDGSGRPLDEWTRVGPLIGDTFSAAFEPPSVPAPLLAQQEDDEVVMLLWVLTCAPGVCDVIERVRANPAPGTEAWDVAARLLAWPDDWLDAIEPGWASLAVKIVPVRAEADNVNPTITASRDSLDLVHGLQEAGGIFDLTVLDDGSISDLSLQVYSTFGPVAGDLRSTSATLTWQAPYAMVGTGRVYAVVNDDDYGQTVWKADVSVLPDGALPDTATP